MTGPVRVRFLPLLLLALVARPAFTQAAPGSPRIPTRAGARVTTVSGVVFDSLHKRVLPEAMVQLVATDSQARFGQTVASDDKGGFQFNDVPDGRYMIGFYHPVLDSVGIEPVAKELVVANQAAMRVSLSTPSPARLRAAICGPPSAVNSGGIVIGTVRHAADQKPAKDVAVVAEWIEYSIGRGGVSRRTPRKVATTGDNGWFAICNVPSPGSLTLVANRLLDSTDVIEVELAADGYARRELYLGSTRVVTVGDTTKPVPAKGDSAQRAAAAPRRVHVGDGQVTGVAIAAETGQPLQDAQVQIVGGPQTRTNERGEFLLKDAPMGTRVLEVRAVGFYPFRQSVNVIARAPSVKVELLTFKAVLNTVKVTASYNRYQRLEEFKERARSGIGRYLTADDIEKRRVVQVSELFRNMSGVYLEGAGATDTVFMRSPFDGSATARCVPTFYLNGGRLDGLTISDIDVMVRPKEVAGIETYVPGTVPMLYQPAMTGCGVILVWTK